MSGLYCDECGQPWSGHLTVCQTKPHRMATSADAALRAAFARGAEAMRAAAVECADFRHDKEAMRALQLPEYRE